MTGEHAARFLFVPPCLKKDATSCWSQQSCNKVLTIQRSHAGVVEGLHHDMATHSGGFPNPEEKL